MAWEDNYDNARRVAFFSKDQRNTRGEPLFNFNCPFHLVNVNGDTFYETRPDVGKVGTDGNDLVGLPLGQVQEVYTEMQRIDVDQINSYNGDPDTPVFEMHPGV